jgi:PPOX class probable F420-dependent enzyme
MVPSSGFSAFSGHKTLNLETFKKSGESVRTPVWFAADPSAALDSAAAKLYIYTVANTGKVKRVRNNPRVRVAPCDNRGKLLGEWVEAKAEVVSGEEATQGLRLLDKKYFPWKQIMNFFAMFRRQGRDVLSIRLP